MSTFIDALAAVAAICALGLTLGAVSDWRWRR